MSIETQQELATDFVREVVARFGIDATTSARRTEDDGIYISVDGDNLGLLVGPKGATVEALQELQEQSSNGTPRSTRAGSLWMSVAIVNGGPRRCASSCLRPLLMCYVPVCPRRSNRCRHQTGKWFTTRSTTSKV